VNDCIDILRSISATCASLNQIGGVDKRVWVTQLSQIGSYTFDSDGYVNSLVTKENGTTNYGYELAQIIGKKNTHNGSYEGVVGENISLIKQNAVLKIYADTPSDRDKVIDLFDAQELVVFFENSNGKIEVFGLDKGLEGSALVGGTGTEMQDDTAVTITLTGDQNKLPYYFLYGGSLATSIEYLDNVGLTPIYVIDEYTAGTTTIDFTHNTGDDFDIDFKIAPTSYQPDTESIDSYDWEVTFWAGGNDTALGDGNETADSTFNVTGNGAGVYDIDITYNLSGGSTFKITKLVKVDGSGTILAIVEAGGVVVNSVVGLDIDVTADITQVGVTYPITWGVLAGGVGVVLPQTGANVLLALPSNATKLFTVLTLDAIFTDDYSGGGALVVSEVTIS